MWRQFLSLPHTRLGGVAVGLTAVSVLIIIFSKLTPGLEEYIGWVWSGWSLSGLAGGVVALIAVLRSKERSGLVGLSMVVAVLCIPVIPFVVQWWLYVLNSPWYSP
jgi:hypothetical protein